MEKEPNKQLIILLPKHVHEKFYEICLSNYKTMSEVLKDFVINYIKKNKDNEKI